MKTLRLKNVDVGKELSGSTFRLSSSPLISSGLQKLNLFAGNGALFLQAGLPCRPPGPHGPYKDRGRRQRRVGELRERGVR